MVKDLEIHASIRNYQLLTVALGTSTPANHLSSILMQVNLFQLHGSCTKRRFENGKETSLEEELQLLEEKMRKGNRKGRRTRTHHIPLSKNKYVIKLLCDFIVK